MKKLDIQTLDQLKDENAEIDNEEELAAADDLEEDIEAAGEGLEDDDESSQLESDASGNEPDEAFLQTEEQHSDDKPKKFTDDDMAGMRKKFKARAQSQTDEIERLRKELESRNTPEVKAPVKPVRPKRAEFKDEYGELDGDAFDRALDAFEDKVDQYEQQVRQYRSYESQQVSVQQRKAEAIKQRHVTGLSGHDKDVQELVNSQLITADAYFEAEEAVRASLDNAAGNPAVTEHILSLLGRRGEGSAKVVVHLQRNPAKLAQAAQALLEDPSGLEAVAFLSEVRASLVGKTATKRNSRAPAPPSKLNGSGTQPAKSAGFKKSYDKAGSVQDRINIKTKAKRAGIDTSNW